VTGKAGYCQHDAGILTDDKLSDVARRKFIEEVKSELVVGTLRSPVSPLPCGPEVPPLPYAELLPLEDESRFPEFHKNVLGMYEKIAKALDAKSQFSMLPICDPTALAIQIDVDVPELKFPDDFVIFGFALPLMAVKLGFDIPVDLAVKFPSILVPLPKIPPFEIPEVDFDPLKLPDLFKFNAALNGIPPALIKIIPELFIKMPQLALGVLSFDLKPFCDAVFSAQPFGPFDPNTALTWLVAMKVLTRKTAECVLINVVGTTLGSSSVGIVGGLGKFLGYTPPTLQVASNSRSPRDAIVKSAKAAQGSSIGSDKESLASTPPDKIRLPCTSFMLPTEVDDGKAGKPGNALRRLEALPFGPLFARACLFRGGTTDKFYTGEAPSDVAQSLRSKITSKSALKPTDRKGLPALKKGDIIVCGDTSIVLTRDYEGGLEELTGILAGVVDGDNDDKLTAIDQITASVSVDGSNIVIKVGDVEHVVSYVIDSEKALA
jgi:hypothetical protein